MLFIRHHTGQFGTATGRETAHVLAYSIDDARRRPIPPPNQGMADTLEEAQAAFKKRYEEVKRGK
jgi:hypothetical protein